VKKGLTKDCLLSALGTFAYLTAYESQKASAAAISVGSLKTAWTTVALGTATSKPVVGVLGLVLGLVLLVNLTVPEVPAPNPTLPAQPAQAAPPIPDNSLSLIFDDAERTTGYTNLAEVSRSNHLDDEPWEHFVFWPQLEPVRTLESAIDDTSCSLLLLHEGRWIEYALPRAIEDRPGPEIVIYLCNWGTLPGFFVTDGRSEQWQIHPSTFIGSYPYGNMGLGFDLSEIDCPFVIRGIRVVSNDSAGPYGGCGIDPPKVYLEPVDPVFRGGVLLRDQ
jgi:hypothetical protein